MRRLWIPALIASMSVCFPVLVSTAATPPKPGSVCKKANLTQIYLGKKYTCIKSGKKLVWSKGVPVAQPKPSTTPSPTTSVSPIPTPSPTATPSPTPTTTPQTTPTPTPSSTPTPTPVKLEAWQLTRNKVVANYQERSKSGRYFEFEFILSPTVNIDKAKETMDAYKQASRNWTWLFDSAGTYSIIWVLLTEKDYDWWYAKVTELQGKNSIYPWDKSTNMFGHCELSPAAFCGYGNTQEAPDGKMKLFQYNVIGSGFQGKPVANTVHHESVHFYQLANNMTYPRDLPCWYIEGQATFYGNVISGTNDSSYERSRIISSLPNSPSWNESQWLETLNSFQSNGEECRKDSRNYSIGSFLWEYLLINYSEEQLHQAHIALKTQTWAGVAPLYLGKTSEALNLEFAKHMVSVMARK